VVGSPEPYNHADMTRKADMTMEITIPRTIKGYRLIERIGSGGFGAVYRARQSTVNREVALKVILPGLANQPDFIRRFETEAMLIARLEHPHIVPLYDYWRDQTGAYLVMRYLKGGSLRNVLDSEDKLGISAIVLIMEQICSALDLAHRSQVIHRDIKPDNILLDEDGNAYLADFGIAKDLDVTADGALTGADAVVGSLDYISPEQARSEAITARTDIYSLGVTLHELLTGKHPFHEFKSIERLFKHINEPLPDLSDIEELDNDKHANLNDVLQTATAKNPDHRYASVGDFYQAFVQATGFHRETESKNIIEQLTLREQEILQLIADSLSNREIAENLFISVSTVKWHIKQLYKKLGVRSRVQAIVRARELDLIIPEDTDAWLNDKINTNSSVSLPEPENPYKGLQAFQAVDAIDYFGQEKLVEKLLKRMGNDEAYKRFLAIIGPSGSGKSSLIRAGLIPALWNGRLPGSEKWFVVEMLPGTHPIEELEVALSRVAANQTHNLNEHLNRDERGLLRTANLILPQDDTELLLVIDQFEELFTLVSDEAKRQSFLKLIETAVIDPRSRVRIIVTLRADYYDKPLHYTDFGEILRSRMETILPMGAQALERVIRGPADRVKVIFEDGLIAQIVSEMTYQIGALPMLQYALTELFNRRNGRVLTHDAYQEIGGAVGALAHRADEIYYSFAEDAQEIIRQIFLRLVTLGEGAEDTRRRVNMSELIYLTGQADVLEEIIDAFAEHRLLSLGRDDETRQATVEVAHEAILQEWNRLRQWISASREDIRFERQLSNLATDWDISKRDNSYLLRGARLEQFSSWYENTELLLTPIEVDFLQNSKAQREREIQAEKERKAREVTLEQRSLQRLRLLVVVFVVSTCIAILLAMTAMTQRNVALNARATSEARANDIQSRVLVDNAENALANGDTQLAAIFALEAAEINRDLPGVYTLVRDIANSLYLFDRVEIANVVDMIQLNDDFLVVMTDDLSGTQQFLLFEIASGEIVQRFEGHQLNPYYVSMSPDNLKLLSSSFDGHIILWDVASGQELFRLEGFSGSNHVWNEDSSDVVLRLTEFIEFSIEFSAEDGFNNLVSDNLISLDVATNEIVILHSLVDHYERDIFVFVNIAPDRQHMLALDGGSWGAVLLGEPDFNGPEAVLLLFELDTMTETQRFENVLFGKFIMDELFTIIEIESNIPYFSIYNITTQNNSMPLVGFPLQRGYSLLDNNVFTYLDDDGIVFTDLMGDRGELARIIPPNSSSSLAFVSANGETIFNYNLGAIEIWKINLSEPNSTIRQLNGHADQTKDIDLSPDGTQILTTGGNLPAEAESTDTSVALWDFASLELIHRMEGHTDTVLSVEFSPDGTRAISGGMDNRVIYWDLTTGEPIHIMENHSDWVWDVYFSPDGQTAISSSKDKSIILWDLATGEPIRTYSGHSERIWNAVFSPDGSMIASSSNDTTVIIWDVATGDIIHQIDAGNTSTFHVEFTPDGQYIYVGMARTGLIQQYDVSSGELLRTLDGHNGAINDLEIDPSGQYMISSGDDAIVILWDLETGQPLQEFDSTMSRVWDTTFGPSPQTIIYAYDTIYIRDISSLEETTVDLTLDELINQIRTNWILRELTCTEREVYNILPLCEAGVNDD